MDFASKILKGSAAYTVGKKASANGEEVLEFILDTNGLDVSTVFVDGAEVGSSTRCWGTPVDWRWGIKHAVLGHSLHVPFPPALTAAGGTSST